MQACALTVIDWTCRHCEDVCAIVDDGDVDAAVAADDDYDDDGCDDCDGEGVLFEQNQNCQQLMRANSIDRMQYRTVDSVHSDRP